MLLAAVEQFEDQTTTRVLIAALEEYEDSGTTLVSSPDLIRRVYRLQYNARDTESDLRWGWFWVWDQD